MEIIKELLTVDLHISPHQAEAACVRAFHLLAKLLNPKIGIIMEPAGQLHAESPRQGQVTTLPRSILR